MPHFLKILQAPDTKLNGIKLALVEGKNLLGRAAPPSTIQLDGTKVSKKHCLVKVVSGAVAIEDLGSANGVFVNGAKISKATLKAGDRIVVGEFTLEVTVN